jgi:hypothetical protein
MFFKFMFLNNSSHHPFDSHREEMKAQCLQPQAPLGIHPFITSGVFPFEVLLQWSDEVEVAWHKV